MGQISLIRISCGNTEVNNFCNPNTINENASTFVIDIINDLLFCIEFSFKIV